MASTTHSTSPRTGWASLLDLNGYQWFVFIVAALGWLADCMDQQLFVLARVSAVADLLQLPANHPDVKLYATYATSVFLMGWAIGGLGFGVLGDRWGRVKTMLLTILVYSIFTGLSATSTGYWDFLTYRFLTGLGVGGEFAVGVALIAEVMPSNARPFTLGLMQASTAIGNIAAGGLFIWLGSLEHAKVLEQLNWFGYGPISAWRLMFLCGVAPALLALVIRRRLREPEKWREAATGAKAKSLGDLSAMFADARWRRHALLGLALTFSGVVGLWGIAFFTPDLMQSIFRKTFAAQGFEGADLTWQVKLWTGIGAMMIQVGAFFGMFAFSWLTHYTGRRPAFALAFIIAAGSTAFVFLNMKTQSDVFWMLPVMGFGQLAVFGGYAIYLPELFPTHLRSTGTSFCYNVGRFVAAIGPFALGKLTNNVFNVDAGYSEGMRQAGTTMCLVFLIGLLALPFLPETKGQPLPE